MKLAEMKCEACRPGSPAMSRAEARKWLEGLTGWEVVDRSGMDTLEKTYKFKDFAGALDFTNRVGAIAEEENHHPALLTEWGKVTVTWWTHAIGGIHKNDLVMAAKTEELGGA